MAQLFSMAPARGSRPQRSSTVYIFPAKSGAWIVRDEDDRKGGMFTTRKAATRFIKREFGKTTSIINANPHIITPSIAV